MRAKRKPGLTAALVAALLASLVALAPAASAETLEGSRIQNFWGNKLPGDGVTGGLFHRNGPRGVAVNDASGDVYVADTGNNRVQEFDENGNFIRAWGQDVVISGPNDLGTAYEICDTTTGNVAADCKEGIATAQTGGAMSSPAGIAIDQTTGDVYVADTANNRVQQFDEDGKFIRAFGRDVIVGAGPPPNSNGTGFEVCDTTTAPPNSAADCKAGSSSGALGGSFNMPELTGETTVHGDLTIAPAGAPNQGDVLVTDPARQRVQEFSAAGAFVRAFGRNVNAVNPSTGFEVCTVATQCKAGTDGSAAGHFANGAVNRVAEDPAGNVYTVEAAPNKAPGSSNFRVQRFTLPGNVLTPQGAFACAVLCGTSSVANSDNKDNPSNVAVDDAGYVYVSKTFPPGAGTPPAISSQQRVLKVNPASGAVLDSFLANPGSDLHPPLGWSGLAVRGPGSPLYVAAGGTGGSPPSRVFRVEDIGGLTATISASGVAAASATLEATIAPAEIPLDTSYRFEYSRAGFDEWSEFRAPKATNEKDAGANIGNGADGGESSSCSPEAGSRAAICHVSQQIDGLERNQAYQFRLVASTPFNGLVLTTDPEEFETAPSPPSATSGIAVWSGPPTTPSGPSLVFNGQVNPQALQTSFSFQYVSEADFGASGYANAKSAPLFPNDVGHGVVSLDVTAVANGLDPADAYVYRILATNAEGTSFGADRVVEPAQAPDRFIELISEGDSQGLGVSPLRPTVSDDGERVMFLALAFAGQPSAPSLASPNISTREGSGWKVTSVSPDAETAQTLGFYGGTAGGGIGAGDAEMTKRLWLGFPSLGSFQWRMRDLDGGFAPVGPVLSPLQRAGKPGLYRFKGGSTDLSTIVFQSFPIWYDTAGTGGKTLLADEPLVLAQKNFNSGHYSNLYAIDGADSANPALDVVNRGSGGGVIGGACGAGLGAESESLIGNANTRAISADGSTIYFSARAGAAADPPVCDTAVPLRIFKRINLASTVAVSESECDRVAPAPACSNVNGDDIYWGASADGSKVYFSTNRQLANSDLDSGTDLYLYDSTEPAGQRLTQVSAGESVLPEHPDVGSGANVLGVADVSMDGSRVYFVASGRLTAAATAGANNLYVYERDATHPGGRIGFLATLQAGAGAGDYAIWTRTLFLKPAYALPYYDGLGPGRTDGDGHLLVFLSKAPLDPEDQDSVADLYRWDNQAEELTCLSCAGDGNAPVRISERKTNNADADAVQQQRIASEDGSAILFGTQEQLLAADTNTAPDVYLWRAGQGLELISGATGERGVEGPENAAISPDGHSVFFLTRATILPQDTNNSAPDYYVARVGGGFRQEEGSTNPCQTIAEACHVDPPPPPAPGAIPSSTLQGAGNVIEKKPRPCPKKGKHRVRRHGKARCVPNKHKKKHSRQRRAGASRRASR